MELAFSFSFEEKRMYLSIYRDFQKKWVRGNMHKQINRYIYIYICAHTLYINSPTDV